MPKILWLLWAMLMAVPAVADSANGKLQVTPVTASVFMHTSFKYYENYGFYPSNGLIIVKDDNAYLIDTPWSEADSSALLNWIDASGYRLKAAIITHFHPDRSAGLALLNARGVPTHAYQRTNERLAALSAATATHSFSTTTMQIPQTGIHVFYPGKGHSDDNVVVWLEADKVLFGGCLVRSYDTGHLGNISDASIEQWQGTLERVTERFLGIELVVPGHGAAGGPELLSHTQHLAKEAAKQ